MIFSNHKQAVLTVLIATALGGVMITDAVAQSRSSDRSNADRRGGKQSAAKAEVMFPNATREEPSLKSSPKLGKQLQKMIDSYNDQKFPETRAAADEILANSAANNYDKALAAQLASQAAYNLDDSATAIKYLDQVLQFNGLDNNGHYQSMLMKAQLQIQEDQTAAGLATLDQYLNETKSTKPEELIIKGQALYQLERYAEAIPVLKQAIAASPEPKDNWNQLLMASYSEAGQTGEAVKEAEAIAARSPDDKKAQMNLASMYMQADQMGKAAEIMGKLYAAGKLTDEREYKQLYSIYANTEGKEQDVIKVINDGIAKGTLKQDDYQAQLALAQAYYYSEPAQVGKAIEAWQKAAPLSKDGETYLNLARVLHAEGRIPEAKAAAQQALAKGVKNQADAKKIINLK